MILCFSPPLPPTPKKVPYETLLFWVWSTLNSILWQLSQIYLVIITLARVGGGYSSQFVCVCVCVCVLPQNWCLNSIISKSEEATVLKHGNHTKHGSLQDRKFFLVKATQIASKLGNKKLIVQISHERLLNQANGCILLGT